MGEGLAVGRGGEELCHGRGLLKALASRIVVALGAFVALAASAPAANAVDVHAFANGCYSLRDATTSRVVVKDALGYATKVPGVRLRRRFG